jgi:hypothetical protein
MKKLLPFFSLLCLVNIALAQKAITLKLNLKKGVTYYTETTINQEIQLQQPKAPVSMKQTFTFGYDMKVSGVTDSGTIIETTYRKVKLSMMNMEFNSDTPSAGNPMFQKIFGNMVNKSFWIVVNKNGTITSVKGMHDLVSTMIKDLPANPQMESNLRNEYNDAKMLQSFNQSFDIYAAGPVKPGSTWNKKQTTSLLGNGTSTAAYSLISLNKKIASLQATTAHDLEMSIGAGGKLSGTSTSNWVVDTKSGFPLKGKTEMTLEGKMKNGDGYTPARIISSILISGTIKNKK